MMTWILGRLAGPLAPALIGLMMALVGWQALVTIPALKAAATAAQTRADAEQAKTQTARTEAALRASERDQLRAAVEVQNDMIEAMATRMRKLEERAKQRGTEVLHKPLAPPPGQTLAELNEWPASLFSR